MPTIEASKKDLESLVGRKFSREQLEEALLYVKGELDKIEGDSLTIDVKETNRPELWSVEGIARELRTKMGIDKGIRKYKVQKAKTECIIEKSVEKSRPFIACAIVRNVKVTEELLVQMIQLQEKVGGTFGRRRKETGIGLYDFDKITPPMYYRGYKDNEIEFVPLDYRVKMKPSEILMEHPKGKEFAHLLKGLEYYPIVIDSKKVVASMPPIINSETTGKVTEKTKNIFLEVTGFNWEIVNVALKVMCMAFADRGSAIEAVRVVFPKGGIYPKQPIETPHFGTKKLKLDVDYVNRILGLALNGKQIVALLEKSGMEANISGKKIEIEYPDYRQDILHPVDIVEDIVIGYGYNNIKPAKLEMNVVGEELKERVFADKVRDVCAGIGLQEVLTFNLTSIEKQSSKIMLKDEELVEIANPVSSNWAVLRKRLMPELLEFFAKNKHAEYPQKIFEVGTILEIDPKIDIGVRQKTNLCVAITDHGVNFTQIKSVLEAVVSNMGLNYSLSEAKLPFLEKGKGAEIKLGGGKGFVGELNPKTLANFGLDKKTAVLEIELY